ncbi:MAG: hypothetical protein JRI25_28910 [Deltaproteobacteria bacterium]|nr:hypothetical protein [Deltaproteobacteria bacterium]
MDQRIEEAIRAVLPSGVQVQTSTRDSNADLTINGVPIEAKWVGEGWLRDLRPVLASLHHPDIVIARRISPGAREALRDAEIGWVDETGAAEIAFKSIIVSRSGHPRKGLGKHARWTPAVLGVAEALLCGTRPTVAATTADTGLSTGSCTMALRVLADLGLLTANSKRGRNSGRRLVDPDRLLDAYAVAAASMVPGPSLRVGVVWRDAQSGLVEVGSAWDRAGVAWAATGTLAASVLAPLLTLVSGAEVYVDTRTIAGLEAIASEAGLRPIEGGRLVLAPFPTTTAQRLVVEEEGLRVAPWPRIYADVRMVGVRGEEAAEHLREVVRGG